MLTLLRFTLSVTILGGLTSCIGLSPKPDTTKTYALGLSDLTQSAVTPSTEMGYIMRPEFPAYMEGYGLKFLSHDGKIVDLPGTRWAESVDMGVARALSYYIERESGYLRSDFYPWIQTDDVAFTLEVKFHHLIATKDGRILVSASWEYNHAVGKVKKMGIFKSNTIEWSPGSAKSMVAGINEALELLSIEIVESLEQRQR